MHDSIGTTVEPQPAAPPDSSFRLRRAIPLLLVLCSAVLIGWLLERTARQFRWAPDTLGRHAILAADFESHPAVLMRWPDDADSDITAALIDIVRALNDRTKVVVATSSAANEQAVQAELRAAELPMAATRFVITATQHQWPRELPFRTVKTSDGAYALLVTPSFRTLYSASDPLTSWLSREMLQLPHDLELSNMACNGQGLCISTTKLLHRFGTTGTADVKQTVADFLGGNELVLLEPLEDESTGNIHRFMAFVTPDTVVVGAIERGTDARNAEILDRNAETLAGLKTSSGPLRVERIPMPARSSDAFRTYTDVIIVNRAILIPRYDNVDPQLEQRAISVYRRLLPGWKVVSVNAEPFLAHGSSLRNAVLPVMDVDERVADSL